MNTKKIIFALTSFLFFYCNITIPIFGYESEKNSNKIIIQIKTDIMIKSNDGIILLPEDITDINNKHGVVSIKPVFEHTPDISVIKTKYLQRAMRAANTSFKKKQYNFKNFFILSSKDNLKNAIDDYKNNDKIISAEPDEIFYSSFNTKKSDIISNNYLKLINAENTQRISLGSPYIIIAVLDSGIDLSHPAIFNRIWINKKEKPNNIDDDLNGFIDDINGYNFQNFSNDITDYNGHGTFIAGIIGALPIDNTNVQGMNRYSQIMPVKITSNDGGTNISAICSGIYYAVNNGADIINISIGAQLEKSVLLSTMLDYAYETGCIIVIPENVPDGSIFFSNYKNVISVAQYNKEYNKNDYSSKLPDISAPDRQITSLMSKNFSRTTKNFITASDSFGCAAIVSATVSLMLSINAGLYVDEIKNIIKNTSLKPDGNFPLLNCETALNESYATRGLLTDDLLGPSLAAQQESLKKITIRGDSLVAFLIEQCHNEKESAGKKGILIHALGEIKSNAALPYLIDQLKSENNNYLKRNIIEAIGKIGDPDTLDILTDALNDSNAGIRYKAAIALGRLGIKEAGANLMNKLEDPDERVVTESIESITKIRYEKAVPHFNELINDNFTDQFMKDQMVYAIGELGDKTSLSALFLYKKNIISSEPANNIVKYKWEESIKIINEAIKKIESRNE